MRPPGAGGTLSAGRPFGLGHRTTGEPAGVRGGSPPRPPRGPCLRSAGAIERGATREDDLDQTGLVHRLPENGNGACGVTYLGQVGGACRDVTEAKGSSS